VNIRKIDRLCYRSLIDVFAATSSFIHLYTLCYKEKEKAPEVVANDTTQVGKCTVFKVHWQIQIFTQSVGYIKISTGCLPMELNF
jgi:hypothetical protein